METVARFLYFAALSLLLLSGCASGPVADDQELPLDQLVSRLRRENGVPAAAYAVIDSGETVEIGAQGWVRNGRLRTVTLESAFQISSNTKAITALLAGIAVEHGEISWETTIAQTLGRSGYEIPEEYANLTLEQLLSHTAGVPPIVDIDTWSAYLASDEPTAPQRRRMIVDIMSLSPRFPAGTSYEYSNMGYVIAGAMLEVACGATWEQLVTDRIFVPLGIESGGFGPPAASGERFQPWGHNPGSVAPDAIGSDGPPGGAPAGAVHANIGDLATYVRVWLNEGAPLISRETYAQLITPRRNQYALGWGSFENEYGRVLTHDGCNMMFRSTMYLMPDIDSAVIIVANDGSDESLSLVHELWVHLMQTNFGNQVSEAGGVPAAVHR